MGQYHILINLDKKEFVHPHKLGLGLKQREHSFTKGSIGDAIYILLSLDNGKGGGDMNSPWHTDNGYFGRWVGDHVAVIGDYNNTDMFSKNGKIIDYSKAYNLTHEYDKDWCHDCEPEENHYKDISDEIVKVFDQNLPFNIVEEDAYETSFRKRLYK